MKTFGRKEFITQLVFSCIGLLIFAWLFFDKPHSYFIGFIFLIGSVRILTYPLIHIGEGRLKIFTLNPFRRNINIELDKVEKIVLEYRANIRFIIQLKNGREISKQTIRYHADLQPLYEALYYTGVPIETVQKSLWSF